MMVIVLLATTPTIASFPPYPSPLQTCLHQVYPPPFNFT